MASCTVGSAIITDRSPSRSIECAHAPVLAAELSYGAKLLVDRRFLHVDRNNEIVDRREDVDPDEVTAGLESAASALAQRSARLVKSRYVASGLSMQPWYKERIFTKAHSIELMADACALARAPTSFTLKEILPLHQAVIDAAKAIKHLLANDGRRDVALDLMLEHSAGWSCGKGGPSPRIGDIGTEAFLTRCLG